MQRVHVIAATGRSGRTLVRALVARGINVVPVVRDAARFHALGLAGPHCAAPRLADLHNAPALAAALADATHIASTAHARHAAAILAAAPAPTSSATGRIVLLGSTRRFSRWPDAHGQGVLEGEAAWRASGRQGVMLHPTMIYGAQGEDNVQRLARLLRRLPLVPLPGGGRNLVQPIHQDDMTACIIAALQADWHGPETLVVAGPTPTRYADFVRAIAAAAGLAPPRIVPVPAWALMAATPLTLLPLLPRIRPGEIRRLLEDKDFNTSAMTDRLGVWPMALTEGLKRCFQQGSTSF